MNIVLGTQSAANLRNYLRGKDRTQRELVYLIVRQLAYPWPFLTPLGKEVRDVLLHPAYQQKMKKVN